MLEKRLSTGRVLTVDLPGVGTENQRACPTQLQDIMEDVRARFVAQRTQHPGTWRILAVSLGGMVAQAWADAHPDDFVGVVLVNTSAANLSVPWERMQPGVLLRVLRAMAHATNPPVRERIILSMVSRGSAQQRESTAKTWTALALDRPVTLRNGLNQMWAASRYAAPARLSAPVLVLSSQGDELCHPLCSERLARRYKATHRVHPNAGHDLALDDGAWVAEQVAQWLHLPEPGVTVDNVDPAG